MLLIEGLCSGVTPVVQAMRDLIEALQSVIEEERVVRRGRPRVVIDENQLTYLVENGFRVKEISEIFRCPKRTIERRMNELSIRASDFSCICDADLDLKISNILSLHPQRGEKTVAGQLRSEGYKVQRQRIRDCIHRVDPVGVELRSRSVLHRRVYRVKSPNSLWHLDGYHKLIRWNIVIHGAIDGYSRLIMFLKASSNNYASTVFTGFKSAINEFGLPSRIRIDRGGENVMVTRFMLEHPQRGPDRRSAIAGRSVHNQRIERLWRDLYTGCICFFYSFFYFLEDMNILDRDDPKDKYALHFVFLPIIQTQLDSFREGWAHHSLRTIRNRTPLQLWILGLSEMHSREPDSAEINGVSRVSAFNFNSSCAVLL